MITLRPDQTEAVEAVRSALGQHNSVLLRGPTGFGKTVVAAYMAQQATIKRRRVIFAVHRRELAEQTARTFDEFGIKYGFIAAGRPSNPFAVAQIASADTLRNRPGLLKNCALFVPDEAHLWASKTRSDLIAAAVEAGSKVVGLSATPERLDGRPLDMFDALVEGPTEAWLIEHGHLSDYRAFAPVAPDLSGLHARMGDYVTAELEERFDKPSITGDAVSIWRKHANGLRTIVFAISRQHGKHVTEAYNAAGIGAVYIDGETPHHERRDRIAAFADGRAVILVNISLAVEGFDLSAQVGRDVPIEAVQLLNPTKSVARARQMIGRALRPKSAPAIILDHVNILREHGLPDDERVWTLAGRSTRKQDGGADFATVTCGRCWGAFRPVLRVCPYCETERAATPREVEVIEGELEEIKRARAKQNVRQARDLDSVALACVANGYAAGWIMQRMKAIGQPVTYRTAHGAYMDAKHRQAA